MPDRLHRYHGTAVDVTYDASRCIHFAACVRTLPRAFDPGSRPWVMPDNGTPDAVTQAVALCPTGALQYTRNDGGPGEATPATNSAVVSRNGPVYVRGHLALQGEEGTTSETRLALCRCGASSRKPLCDGSHTRARFADPGKVAGGSAPVVNEAPTGALVLEPAPDGPLLVHGLVQLSDASGSVIGVLRDPALCRCGRSGNKPFCDGSHGNG
jgi:CDGSH-type Zn-finger protein/uncharacterized Fe-S cluster protein YjdI